MGVVEQIDREEHKRVQRLLKAARARPHFTEGQQSHAKSKYVRKRADRRPTIGMDIQSGRCPYSNSYALGDALRRAVLRRIEFEAMQGKGVVHVKNGKPRTAEGARMLGVPWPGV